MTERKRILNPHRQKIKDEEGNMSVDCVVSGRWLRFDSSAHKVEGEDLVHVDVFAMHCLGEKDKKICDLMLSLQELEEVINRIKREP